MNRLDDVIRTGLARAAETVSEPPADQLARRITERRSRTQRRTRVGRTVLGAAAVLVTLAAATGALTRGDDESDRVDTVESPADDRGFAAYPPGWHEFDTGPAPASISPSLAWTGDELVIADLLIGTTRSKVSAYSPASRTWRSLGEVPINGEVTIAWAGGHLVAIGTSFPAAEAAIWHSEDDRWEGLDHPPISEAMASSIWGGPRTINGNLELVWTGQRLLDLTHGAALDPESRRWTTMAVPDPHDLTRFSGFTRPVWDGREVVLAGWTAAPGLAWNATGSTYREIPGLPADVVETKTSDGSDTLGDSVATSVDGRVLFVSGTDDGAVASFDARTDTWRREPSMAGMFSGEGCPSLAATVAGRVVAMPCANDTPVVLDDTGWEPIEPHPFPAPCCAGVWIDAGGALVAVWTTGGSDGRTWEEPGIRAAVWLPPGS